MAAARICLLTPAKRASYDRTLHHQLAARAEPAVSEARINGKLPWIAGLAIAAGLGAVLLIAVLMTLKKKDDDHALRRARRDRGNERRSFPRRAGIGPSANGGGIGPSPR